MKGSKKSTSGGMKLTVFCFIIFFLITATQIAVKSMLPMVGDIYLYALGFSYILQVILGAVGVISFIVCCIKRKAMSWSFVGIIVVLLSSIVLAAYSGLPYIKDFTDKPASVTTSDYSVIGKENNKSIYFADNKNKEEALRLDDEALEYLENNNAIDTSNAYVSNTSYLHHISSITIKYYSNTGILKEISVS